MEKCLIQTFFENEIFCESDFIFFFFDTKQFHTCSAKTLSLLPKSLNLFAMNAETLVVLRKKKCLGNLAIRFFCNTVWSKGGKSVESASCLPKGNFRGFWMLNLLKKFALIWIETEREKWRLKLNHSFDSSLKNAWNWDWILSSYRRALVHANRRPPRFTFRKPSH